MPVGEHSQLESVLRPGEVLQGSIDEVRISSIARGAGDFLFGGGLMGDADGDGLVDDDDLSLLLSSWGQDVGWANGNFNGDNIVDDDDLSLLLSNWTGSAPVPGPATLSGLTLGALACLRRRRS